MSKKIKEVHHGKIWQGSNGRWFTYIEENKHRKLVVRVNKEDLEAFLLGHYKIAKSEKEFGMLFEAWNNRRKELEQISPGTWTRNITDYNRFFRDTIGGSRVDKLNIYDYTNTMELLVAQKRLTSKAANRALGIVKGTIDYARRIGYTEITGQSIVNEYRSLGVKTQKVHKEDYEEVYTDHEMEAVMHYLEENPCDVNNAIYLLFLTGMRVGECVALKHSDFEGNTIQIRRTETSYREGGITYRGVKDSPKTAAGYRTIVMPSQFNWFLELIRKQNFGEEWVFLGTDKKMLSQNYVQRRLHQICDKLGIYPKSPHKIRKTYCSILLDNRLDAGFIRQQVGHTDIWCTENFYHRNRRDAEQKTKIMDSIPEFMVNRGSVNNQLETIIR